MFKYLMMTPAYQKWCRSVSSDQCDMVGYTSYLMRVDRMICVIDILWPDFIEKDGLVLRSSHIPDNWDSFMEQSRKANWSSQQIEYVINHLHLEDIFLNDPDRDKISNEVYIFLADTIASAWKSRLQGLFPEKDFDVGVTDRDTSPEIYAYQTFQSAESV